MVYAQPQQGRPLSPGSGRPKRPMWHWLLVGGVAAVGLLVIAAFAILIAFQVLTRGNPQSTLEDFYASLETTDCELFMDSTTQEYRDATGLTSCSIFEEALGGISAIDYQVDERINRQGYAIFEVTESFSSNGEDAEVQLRYYVRRIDGQWDLDGIEVVDPGAEPIT